MLYWFLLAGNEPEKLKTKFNTFLSDNHFPAGVALWKWKKTCWICSPEKFKKNILSTFGNYGIIEFLHGDSNALKPLHALKPPLT
jgi:hypothetical protein